MIKRKDFLPYAQPLFDRREEEEIIACLRSGWVSTGPRTKKFEARFRDYLGAKNAVAVSSCTAGLHLSLLALDIGPGDEVITTPFTFTATGNTIVHTGARPVFVDIEPDTFNLDPHAVERLIEADYQVGQDGALVNQRTGGRLRALIPVHYAGQACDMDPLVALADKYDLSIIEDAAHAVGTTYRGRQAGLFGTTAVFSFYATKNLATGEGGMVVTESEEIADRLRILSLHGISKDAWKRYSAEGSWSYEVTAPGFKYNLSDLMASLGLHQLAKLEAFNDRRRWLGDWYDRELGKVDGLTRHALRDYGQSTRHLYPVLIESRPGRPNRDQFIQAMAERNIGTSVHFIPLHLMPLYRESFGYRRGDFPVCEQVFEKVVSLPLYPKMSDEDAAYVLESVRDVLA